MAFCPKCRSEYRAGITHCATCEVALVSEEELPKLMSDAEIIAALAEEELATVFEGPLASLRPVQEKLLEAGIPAALRQGEELKTEMGLFIKLSLVVRKEDLPRLIELLGEEYREDLAREGLLGDAPDQMDHPEDPDHEEGSGNPDGPGEGKALACPACGCTEPLVDGECPDCGLFLGEGEG
jgi:hypothetical protein